MKKLLEDLEKLYKQASEYNEPELEYKRLHNFLTKLAEVDLEECEEALSRIGNEIIKGDYGFIGISEHYDNEVEDLQNLIDILKEIENDRL